MTALWRCWNNGVLYEARNSLTADPVFLFKVPLLEEVLFYTHIYPHKYRVTTSIQPFSTHPERSGWIWYTCQASLFHSQSHNGFPVLLLASACVSVDINVTLNSSSFLSTASLCQLFFHKEDQGSQMLYLNGRLSASWKNLCCPLNRQVYLQIQMKLHISVPFHCTFICIN